MFNLQRTFIPFMLATVAILFGVAYGVAQSIPTQVQTVDWNPNGNNIAVGFSNGIVQIVNADNQVETTLDASSNVVSVTWNPAGDKLAFANAYGGLWIWDSTTAQTTQINPQDEFIRAVAWSPDGVRLASANQSGTGPAAHNRVRIWDTVTGQLQITIEENILDFYLNSIDWNPVDGNQLAAGTGNGAVVVWNTQSGKSIHVSYPESDPSVGITTVAWNSDGTRLAAGASNGSTWVWNTTTWETEFSFAGGITSDVEWSLDSRLAIADSNIVRVVEPATGQILGTEEAADIILALSWSPNGEKLAFGGITYSETPSIEIVSFPFAETPTLPTTNSVYTAAWSPDGSMIAVSGGGAVCNSENADRVSLAIFDAITLEAIQTVPLESCAAYAIDWSPDSANLAIAGVDPNGLSVWNVTTGQFEMTSEGGEYGMVDVKWNPDGTQLATAGTGNSIVIFDLASEEFIQTAPIRGTRIDWNTDGAKLASVSGFTAQVYIADMETLQQVMVLDGHTVPSVYSIDWDSDGTRLVTSGADNKVRVWDAYNGQELLTLEVQNPSDAQWSPDSRTIATVSLNGIVQVWDGRTGHELGSFAVHPGVSTVTWSPDGTQLAYGGVGGMLEIASVPGTETPPSTDTPNP